MPESLPKDFQLAAELTPAPLWAPMGEPVSEGSSGRWSLVDLEGIQAPYPQLHDLLLIPALAKIGFIRAVPLQSIL